MGYQLDNFIMSTLGNATEASYFKIGLPTRSGNNASVAYADDFSIETID